MESKDRMRPRRQQRPPRSRQQDGTTWAALAGFFLLLAIPSLALSRLASWIDWRFVVGTPVIASCVTYFMYRSDKRSAEAGEWRIPEATLHMAELAGGWPGAFLAQRDFRHKTSKRSYQVEFWLIVAAHQIVAMDSMLGWRLSKQVLQIIKDHVM